MEKPVCREEGQPLFRQGKSPLQTLLKPCYVRLFGWSWRKWWREGGFRGCYQRCKEKEIFGMRGKCWSSFLQVYNSLIFKMSCFVSKITFQESAAVLEVTEWRVSSPWWPADPSRNQNLYYWPVNWVYCTDRNCKGTFRKIAEIQAIYPDTIIPHITIIYIYLYYRYMYVDYL